jgi:serine/threonine-protein kinase
MRRILGLIAFSSLSLASILVGGQRVFAQDQYGAIAYSSATTAYGMSKNYATQSAAELAAVTECERYGGASDCQPLVWFKNACGAIATNADGDAGTGWGENVSTANYYSLQSCAEFGLECVVADTICTD